MAAIFLRTQIVLVQIGNGRLETAMIAGTALVDVTLNRAHSEIAYLLHFFGQEQTNTESGDHLVVLIDSRVCFPFQHAGRIHRPRGCHSHDRAGSHSTDRHGILYANDAIFFQNKGFISTGIGYMMLCQQPRAFNLAVIVGRRAPNVQLHRLFQQFLPIDHHGLPQTGALTIYICKVVSGYGDPLVIFGYVQFTFRICCQELQRFLISAVTILQFKLVKAKRMTLGQQFSSFLQVIGELQVAIALLGDIQLQRNRTFAAGQNHRQLPCLTGRYDRTVTSQLIGNRQIVFQIQECKLVAQGHDAGSLIVRRTSGAMHVFKFHDAGMRPSVGVHKAIHAEVSVMNQLVMIATVVIHGFPVFSITLEHSMIQEFPYETTTETRIGFKLLEIILQVTGAVAHGMRVFALDKGLVGILRQIFIHEFQGSIHLAPQIQVGIIILTVIIYILGGFIMGQTAGIKVLRPSQCQFKAATVGRLIAHGPNNSAGTVLIPLNHPLYTVHDRTNEIRIVCHHHIPFFVVAELSVMPAMLRTVSLNICFVDNIETITVTEIIEKRMAGIVAGANTVEIVFFQKFQFPFCLLKIDDISLNRVRFMAVDTTELNERSIEIDNRIFDADLTKTYIIDNGLPFCFQHHSIKIRLLRIPQHGISDI